MMKDKNATFSFNCVHPETVKKIILDLKNSKSCGVDNIDTYIVKLMVEDVLPAITHIVNLCRNIHKKMTHFHKNELLISSGFEGAGRENVYDIALETLLSYGRIPLVTEKISAADKILSALVRKAF